MRISKWLFGVCLAVLVVFGTGMRTDAALLDASGIYEYEENSDGTVSITGYKGTAETVTVPSEIDGKAVSGIRGFDGHEEIKHVIISEGIVNLEFVNFTSGVFEGCKNLKIVSLPSTMRVIGAYAFYRCGMLENIILPDNLCSIGEYAFFGCSLLKKVIIPDSVNYIGNMAFEAFSKILICANPDSCAKTYADHNFIKFSCIEHANIVYDAEVPATCTENGKKAGSHCIDCGSIVSGCEVIPKRHQIITVEIPPTCIKTGERYTRCKLCNFKYIDEKGSIKWGVLIPALGHKFDDGVVNVKTGIKTDTCTVCGAIRKSTPVKVEKNAVVSNSNILYKVINAGKKNGTVELQEVRKQEQSVRIPDTLKLNGITFKVTSIAKDAFKNNKILKKVTIGKNVTKISSGAFQGCKNLKTITIKSKNIKSVGKNAFKGISSKAKIKVPSSRQSKYKKLLRGKR